VSSNANLLLNLFIDVLESCVLLQILSIGWPTTWWHVLSDHGYRIKWHSCTLSVCKPNPQMCSL